jgi:AcrR family transcriptional regulator
MIEATRAKLISAARSAFAQHGYAQAAMDELTAQAGLTRGALYHHFGGKPGLLAAVVARWMKKWTSGWSLCCEAMTIHGKAFWPIAAPIWPWRRRLKFAASCCRMHAPCSPAPTRGSSTSNALLLSPVLQQLIDEGVIVNASAAALARLLNGCLIEAAFWIAEEGAPERLNEALQALDLMLQGWKAA